MEHVTETLTALAQVLTAASAVLALWLRLRDRDAGEP